MEESLGCWFNQLFITCDKCKYKNDAIGCSVFRKAYYAKFGHEKQNVDKRDSPWI